MREGGPDSSRKGSNASVRFDSLKGEITSPKDLLSRLSTLFRLGDLLEKVYEKRDVDSFMKLAMSRNRKLCEGCRASADRSSAREP
jgi:hypothetical protein